MMKRTTLTAAILAALLVVPTAAYAQTGDAPSDQSTDRQAEFHDQFEEAKERVLEALDKRVRALGEAIEGVNASEHLTAEHAATLIADYEFHRNGLEELRPSVEAAATPEELHLLAEQIVHEHWVFALQIPKGRLTHAADVIADASIHAGEVSVAFGEVLAELEAAGINVDEGWELLADMDELLGTALGLAEPVPSIVLGISVSEMPGASATIEQARVDIRAAHDTMLEVRDTATELRNFIRSVIDIEQ